MKTKLLKRQVYKAWILLPLLFYCLLTAPSLRAATVQITKVTGTAINPTYSPGDILAISGDKLETTDWNALKGLTTGYHLELQTTDVNIPDDALYGCPVLLSVSSSAITTIGGSAFYECPALTTASFPNVMAIGNAAFQNCALTTASFPKAETIEEFAFAGCTALTTASFPNATAIRNSAFAGCTTLTTASFPKAETIGAFAFNGCTALTNAYFPNVMTIEILVFLACSNLSALTLGHTPPALGSGVFSGVSSPLLLVVPDSTAYTSAILADFPAGSEAFNKSVPTEQDIVTSGTPYSLAPNRIPTLPDGTYRWEKDGITIPGATATTWQATAPGLYILRYIRGGQQVALLSTHLAEMPYDLYGIYSRYQGCENVLHLTFTQSTAARTIEVWSEGTGAASLYDIQSGKYFKNTLAYKLAAGDSVLTIRYAVDEAVKDGSRATLVYRIAPGGTTERTDEFTLYAKPDIKLVTYYPTTAMFNGVLDISITNSSHYMQRSLDGGQSWEFARNTTIGEALPFAQSQIAGFLPGTTILFRVPGGCSIETLTVGKKDDGGDPSITRQVTMPAIPGATSSVAPGTYYVNSGSNFTFTLTPTGSNAGKIPQVTTSRTKLPDSEGVVTTNNGDGSYTVTILRIQEAITITIDFATGNALVDVGDRVWSYNGQLYITTAAGGTATVYTTMGSLVKTVYIPAGETVNTSLPGGIYIVSMNGKTRKIMINY